MLQYILNSFLRAHPTYVHPFFATVYAAFLVSRCGHATLSYSTVFHLLTLALEKNRLRTAELVHSMFFDFQRSPLRCQ